MKKGMEITLRPDGEGPFILCWESLDFYPTNKKETTKISKAGKQR